MNEEQVKEILNEAKIQTARHKKKIQIISLVAIIAVIAMATVACIPLIKALHSKAGIAALERKLDNYSGIVGVLIFTFIQALQVVIAVIPPIQLVLGRFAIILRYAPWHNGNIRACEKIWQTDSGSLC